MEPGTAQPRTPWRLLVGAWAVSRLWVWGVAGLGLWLLPRGPLFPAAPQGPLNWLNRWDAGWELRIAREGYDYVPGQFCGVAFFPLYPLLIRWGSLGGVIDPRVVGYAIAHAALLGALVGLWKLAHLDLGGERPAWRVAGLLLLTPVTVFHSAIYTESLFLLWLTGALYAARTRRWLVAGVCGYLAALTRSVGVLVAVVLAWEAWQQHREGGGRRRGEGWSIALACGLPGLGLLTYAAFLYTTFGEPLAFQKVQVAWGRHLTWPWRSFLIPGKPMNSVWTINFTLAAAALGGLGAWWRLRSTYLVLLLVYWLVYTSTGTLEAMPRLLSVLCPLYFVLALMMERWPRVRPWLYGGFALLQVAAIYLFVNGHWFT